MMIDAFILSLDHGFHGNIREVLSYIKCKSFILHVQVMYWCMVYPLGLQLWLSALGNIP